MWIDFRALEQAVRDLPAAASGLLAPSQGSAWEPAIVGAYLAVLGFLSVYGLHRLWLVALWLRYRNVPPHKPPTSFETLPRVTVQLPVYNERFVVEALIDSVCELDYPRGRLEIQVLDDSTDDTSRIAKAAVERWAAAGMPIRYLHREHREGYKAGALEEGLREAAGEFIAIFDADFAPEPDFLRQTIGHFTDGQVGCVQTRWAFRNRDASLLTRIQAVLLDGHFEVEQNARSRSGRFFNFNGTAGVLRRSMIEDAGGWSHSTLAEDTELSYRAQLRGWKFVYRPDVQAASELPVEMAAFQAQQARWAKGLIQTACELMPRLLRSRLPMKVKVEAFFHLTSNLSYLLMIPLAALAGPASLIRYRSSDPWLLMVDAPVFVATFGSLAAFYLLAERRAAGGIGWRRTLPLLPAIVAAGVGLTLKNARGVAEAILGVATPFDRTAKYFFVPSGGAASQGDPGPPPRHERQIYSRRSPRLAWANLAGGFWMGGCALLTAVSGAWAASPFLAVFAAGYFYAGGLTIFQAWDGAPLRAAGRLYKRPVCR